MANKKYQICAFSILALLYIEIGHCMDNSQLAAFADSYQVTGKEPTIYTYENEDCGFASIDLVKKIKINSNRIGFITFQGLCWGAVFTYFEMNINSSESIRPFSEVSSGRSAGFSNWGPSEPSFTNEQLESIAKYMLKSR